MTEGITLIKLKTIPKAEAFAITLEKKGGSSTPDMNAMYVMGKVTG
jgi:anti-sigma-K factor RskA